MKIVVDHRVYDAEKLPVALVFETDQERIKHAENLSNMAPITPPVEDRRRIYAILPDVGGMNGMQFLDYAEGLVDSGTGVFKIGLLPTVGDLKKAIAEMPDTLPLHCAFDGNIYTFVGVERTVFGPDEYLPDPGRKGEYCVIKSL